MIIGKPPNGGDTYVWLEDGDSEELTYLLMGKSTSDARVVVRFDEAKGMYTINEGALEEYGFTTREII